MATFRLTLPPPVNHAYRAVLRPDGKGWYRARVLRSDEYDTWRQEAALVLRGWRPPERTPLVVAIRLYLPKAKLRRYDVDSFVKPLLDNTVGSRADQWIDSLEVRKVEGEGYAEVTVEVKG